MKSALCRSLLLAILTVRFAIAAEAHDPLGHEIVGAIADERLANTPTAEKIGALLDGLTLEKVATLAADRSRNRYVIAFFSGRTKRFPLFFSRFQRENVFGCFDYLLLGKVTTWDVLGLHKSQRFQSVPFKLHVARFDTFANEPDLSIATIEHFAFKEHDRVEQAASLFYVLLESMDSADADLPGSATFVCCPKSQSQKIRKESTSRLSCPT